MSYSSIRREIHAAEFAHQTTVYRLPFVILGTKHRRAIRGLPTPLA